MPANSNDDTAQDETDETTPDDVPTQVNGGNPDEYVDSEKWMQVHQSHYEHTGDGEFVAALVSAVADAKGVDSLDYDEMPPLYDSFDTETLEGAFFSRSSEATQEEIGMMSFAYNGYKVALRSDGWIFVYEPR